MSVLSVQSVSYSYKTKYQTVQAVKDVSCDLSAGTLYALVGKSGSGKTTLLSLLAGLDTPQSGDIMVNGQSLREIDVDIYRRKQASVIYQSYNLFPLMTVCENVIQTRLLRVLSDGYYYRVGGHQSLKANVRIIAATHQNLEAMVRENRFREDLYHRLNVIRLRLPPLRERPEDIPLLVNHFLQKSAENLGVEPKIMSEEAMEFLKRFPFPGNVRQLENLCNWLVVMAPSQHIRVTDLPEEIRRGEAEKIHKNSEVSSEETLGGSWEELLKAEVKEMLKSQSPDLMKQLSDTFESIVIGTALEYTHGRRVDAATRLGIGRNTITRKIAELKLESED